MQIRGNFAGGNSTWHNSGWDSFARYRSAWGNSAKCNSAV